jgi:hypothetical protein
VARRRTRAQRWGARVLGASGFALLLAGPAHASSQAGVAAAVRGNCELTREAAVGRQVQGGEPILLRDEIESGPSSGLQLLLLDETTFTLGAESSIVVDEFIYDPATSAGRVGVNVTKGVFRFVSGKVAKNNPEDVKLRLNGATVGIRGTMVAGRVGTSSLVALLGPGLESNTVDSRGRIVVSNAGVSVEIDRPGFATEIPGPDLPPTPPFALLPEQLDGLLLDLASGAPLVPEARDAGMPGPPPPPEGEQGEESGPPPSQLAGQDTAQGGEFSELGPGPHAGGPGGDLAQAAAQDAQSLQGMLATFEQLQNIPSGVAIFGPVAFGLSGPGTSATATFDYVFDFGAMFGGGNVNLVTGAGFAGGDGSFPLIVDPFVLSGPAEIEEVGNIAFINSGNFPMPHEIRVHYKFVNTTQVPGRVDVQVDYTELGSSAAGSTSIPVSTGGGQ